MSAIYSKVKIVRSLSLLACYVIVTGLKRLLLVTLSFFQGHNIVCRTRMYSFKPEGGFLNSQTYHGDKLKR